MEGTCCVASSRAVSVPGANGEPNIVTVLPEIDVHERFVEELDLSDLAQRVQALSALVGQPIQFRCLRGDEVQCAEQDESGACRVCVARSQLGRLGEPWTHGTLRRALLLCDQQPVSAAFYGAFFGESRLTNADFLQRVVQFRAYAMLAFGSFRYAFKSLASGNELEIRAAVGRWARPAAGRRAYYAERPQATKLVRAMPREDRWFLGYLSGQLLEKDFDLEAALRHKRDGEAVTQDDQKLIDQMPDEERAYWLGHLDDAKTQLDALQARLERALAAGIANTVAYLAANHIDIYVATSMRQRWEYEATAAFVDDVVKRVDEALPPGVVHFDPTLSFTKDRIDKGLIEGLMLRRASVTIYMAQEVDTLGKDSELAATLARGNTVIAFVEDASEDQLRDRYLQTPVGYLRTRALQHLADGRVAAGDVATLYQALAPDTGQLSTRTGFYLLQRPDASALAGELLPIADALARAEASFLKSRATLLRETHPLGLQIDQSTGVAHGVLLARTPEQCADLVIRALTNTLSFEIRESAKTQKQEPAPATILVERTTNCVFRVVTNDATLTNAFWTFYKGTTETEPIGGAVQDKSTEQS